MKKDIFDIEKKLSAKKFEELREWVIDNSITLTHIILNKFCVGKKIWRGGGEYCYGYKCTEKEMGKFIKETESTWDKETIERITGDNINQNENVLMVDEHNYSWGMQDEITNILIEQEYND